MSEIHARHKYDCAACGAEARWDPAKDALVCPYCGTVSQAKLDSATGEVIEHDLATALRNLPEAQRGWDSEKISVKCQSCQAITVFAPTLVAQRCEFCGSSALIPQEQVKAPIRPESLLELKLSEPQIRERVRAWYGSRWFAPNALKSRALTDTVHGLYIPYWTFDAQVHADWTALSGYHYYETETDSQGRSQSRRHTRWVPSVGSLDHFFDDELVAASKGIPRELLRKIEPFPTGTDLKPYNPGYLSGWVVEQYQIDLLGAAEHSRQMMEAKTQALCAAEVPGDTHTNLAVDTVFSRQTFKHVLVPVWLLTYHYGASRYQLVVNGYTGAIAGKHPLSWIKIALAVLAALIALAVLAHFSEK